jgi:hypothetical protein
MNRSIALFVALVTLLAHILAIHSDGNGNFAFPYDQGYVAYRLAHNWVVEQQWSWIPGAAGFESYPSVLWVALTAIAERFSISINLLSQTAGVLSMLFTVVLMAQFRERRTATLIAPLLLVTSGCIAAASANGTETSIFTLFASAAFLCFEREHSARMSIALGLCVLTRPEGMVFAAGMFLLACFGRAQKEKRSLWPYLVPSAVFAIGVLVRFETTGEALPKAFLALLHPHPGQAADGLTYVRDFVLVAVCPVLLVFPLAYLARRRLSAAGARALLLALAWTAMVLLQGRAPLPFAEAMVPAMPFICLAIQEGMIETLDGASQLRRKLALFALFTSIMGSALASKEPGDLGPIPAERWHREWLRSSGSARFGYEQPLGRLGLEEEIRLTNRLRAVGLFLRDNVDASSTVLTPWPGSMGYLSRLTVYDLLGRTNPMPGVGDTSWTRRERGDVVLALNQEPDYVVPLIGTASRTPSIHEIAQVWSRELDLEPAEKGRVRDVESALASFEMITVPIVGYIRSSTPQKGEPFLLLRNRRLELQPNLELALEGRDFLVRVRHRGHYQLVDLEVRVRDDRGRTWYVRPTGDLALGTVAHARTGILLSSGTRAIDLIRCTIPGELEGARAVEVSAVLLNPNSLSGDPLAAVSREAALALR